MYISFKIKIWTFVTFFLIQYYIGFTQSCEYLQEKAFNQLQNKQIDSAIETATLGLERCLSSYGEKSNQYWLSCFSLAILYSIKREYVNAENFYIKALNVLDKNSNEYKEKYSLILLKLADISKEHFYFDKSETFYKRLLSFTEENYGRNDSNYAKYLSYLGSLFSEKGDYKNSEENYLEAIKIYSQFSKYNKEYCIMLQNLALLYYEISEFNKAEALFLEVVRIDKENNLENDYEYATTLNNLGLLYTKVFNYTKAENFYFQALSIEKMNNGKENLGYAMSLNNLGLLYLEMGKFYEAEKCLIEAQTIQFNLVGELHRDYSVTLHNLASLYLSLKLYSKAEEYFIKVIEINKKMLGEEHPKLATSINNLGFLYTALGEYVKAESYINDAINIRKKSLGEQHPLYINSTVNLANIYIYIGKKLEAKKIYEVAIDYYKIKFGANSLDFAEVQFGLASLYYSLGDNLLADSLYNISMPIIKSNLGNQHPKYLEKLFSLSFFYFESGKQTDAIKIYYDALPLISKNWKSNLSFLSLKQSDLFFENNFYIINYILSFLTNFTTNKIKSPLFDLNLFVKNTQLSTNNLLEESAAKSKDSLIQSIWSDYKSLRFQISKQLQLPLAGQRNLNELQEQADNLEKELMRKLPGFKESIENNNLTWQDLQKNLKPNEAVIDFANFQYYDKRWTDTTMYAAFLIRPEWKEPQFVSLFTEDQLSVLFDSTNAQSHINQLYKQKDSTRDANLSLYNLIWRPMDSLLTDVKRIYLSPSGLLHRVSFGAISTPEGGTLNDRYDLHTHAHVRTLMDRKSKDVLPNSSGLYGGIDYDSEPNLVKSSTTPPEYNESDTTLATLRCLRGGKWSYLSGTSEEVSRIKKITEGAGVSTSTYLSNEASEEAFKAMGSGKSKVPAILHIATHGFAFSTPQEKLKENIGMQMEMMGEKRQVFRQATDALTRTGLVMSGGNIAWSKGQNLENREDGILTAREISNMDLRGCMLATLSACETGLGEIKGSEGVFGLQRAFRMAGVPNMIVSLWKVPDKATLDFMELFYSKWLTDKQSIRDAFRQTQQVMSKKYKPYQWAAFVLVE